jgi:hypothetical protein
LGCKAFLTAEETHALGGRGLHADTLDGQPQHFRRAHPHRFAMGADPGALAKEGNVNMDDARASLLGKLARMSQEGCGICTSPLRIAWREMCADIALAQCSQNSVHKRMPAGVRVGMAEQTFAMWNANPA